MPKTGINLFTTLAANVRAISVQTGNYTVLSTDEYVKVNATATMTLPVISTFQQTTSSIKTYFFENIGASNSGYTATIAAGSGNTIGGRASFALRPGEKLIVATTETDTDWTVVYPSPLAPGLRNLITLFASTGGSTAAVNLIDANGSTVVGTIVDIDCVCCDSIAANIITKVGNTAVSTIAKGTTPGTRVGATTIDAHAIAVGDTLTVESSSAGTALVKVLISCQQMTKDG